MAAEVFVFSFLYTLGISSGITKGKNLKKQLEDHLNILILGHLQEYQRGLPVIYLPVQDAEKPVVFFKEDILSIHYFEKIVKFTLSKRLFGTSKDVNIFFTLPRLEDMDKFIGTWQKVSPQIPKRMNDEELTMMVGEEIKRILMKIKPVEESSRQVEVNFLNSFIKFVTKNVGETQEALKQIIDGIDFVPEFLLSNGLDTKQQSVREWFFRVLEIFRERNKCAFASCDGYSVKRCEHCRTHYCNKECQTADYQRHEGECKRLKKEHRGSLKLGKTLESILVERLALSKKCFKFDTFKTKLTRKMFDKSFNLLFSAAMPNKVPDENWQRWLPLVSGELSTEPLNVQFDKAWGFIYSTNNEGSHFSINWKWSFYWFLFLIAAVLCVF